MNKITTTRFFVILLICLELWSSWHLNVKPDAVFLLTAVMIVLKGY